jgi:hypothetical protein
MLIKEQEFEYNSGLQAEQGLLKIINRKLIFYGCARV